MYSKRISKKTIFLSGPDSPGARHRPYLTWKLVLLIFFCALLAQRSGLVPYGQKPDLPLLQKRFELLMNWTLPEVHCDDMHLSGLRRQGSEWLATYRFVVYATEGSEDSPVVKTRLSRRFPECGELLFQVGKACTVEERVRFVSSPPYGLVPEKVILEYPELLSQM